MGFPQQPYGPPPGHHALNGQPMAPAQEQVIWEGISNSLTSAATGGRMAPKYRLTTHHLYFEKGTLSTNAQQVPVHLVADIDVHQTMTQKARGVGDLLVFVDRPSGRETARLESVQDPRHVQQMINQAAHQARIREQQAARAMQYPMAVQVAPVMAQQPVQAQPSESLADLVTQLERLGELVKSGVLTKEEFEAKKADILRRM